MKKIAFLIFSVVIGNIGLSQNNVALWNYNTIVGAPTTTPSDQGVGTSQIIGSLVVANAATGMDPIINNGCGAQNGTNPGAWSFTATPGTTNESSGVQFNASTIGFQNIRFTWDQRWSNTAVNTIRLQYTLDGTIWTNFTMTSDNTTFCNGTIDNGRFQNNGIGDQYRRLSVNLSSITGANNNANFGIRILAAFFQSTSEFRQTANSTLIATGGTWRFDNVSIQGQADVSIASGSNFAQYAENVGNINVPITVSNANAAPINVTFGLSVYSNATENADFTWTNTLTIPANTNGVTNLPISIIDDVTAEKAERIVVKILSGVNANVSLTNNYQIVFIKDNDYVSPTPTNELNLSLLSSFSNGAGGSNSAEIVTFDSSVDRLYIANSIGGKLDIINFSNPSSPVLLSSINLSAYGNINSVVAHDSVIACAIESVPAQSNGKVVFFDYTGNFISQVEVGAMPDMITFNKDYTKILTANEGEPDAIYASDPEGTVSIIDLSPGYSALTNSNVTNVGFTAYNGQETSLRAQGIRVFSTSASVAQDFEPEYIAISDDNTKAYVTLQENNALVTIDLGTSTITSLTALGYSSYSAGSGNALDASDQSGAVLITGDLPIKGAFMPDAMTFQTINGQGLLFTANEGDSREFGSVIDANRISSSTFNNLDITAFPDQSILRNNKFLGRLSALKYSGDNDGDGDYDELHVMGGRSFSIWNPQTGALVYDSKDLIEQITSNHPTFSSIFNASNSTGTPASKNRSDDKGPEPEGVAVTIINGSTYAFVSLERIGGVMIFNVDVPTSPVFVGYANNRSTTLSGPDLGAEGIIIIPASESPNGKTLVILANEVSSTLSIYQINSCADVSGAPINSTDLSLCPGQSTTLTVSNVAGVSYQWLLNNVAISSATNNTFQANLSGNYSLKVTNNILGCTDTTSIVTITNIAPPVVFAGQNQTICGGTPITLNASGATSYSWNNGATGSALTIQTGSTSSIANYIVTGLDSSTGCSNKDTVSVIVYGLPLINAGSDISACTNTLITLTGSGGSSYTWSDNIINGQAFLLTQTTTFTVVGTDTNGCSNSDQITVNVNQTPSITLGNDIEICQNDAPVQITATSNSSGITYTWNSGQNTNSIIVSSTGVYIATATNNNGCSNSDTISVLINNLPGVNLGDDLQVCSNDLPYSILAESNENQLTYNWNTNETSQQIQANSSGTYSVIVTDQNGCESSDQLVIQVLVSPTVNAGSDITVCEYDFPITLNATGNGSQVEWSTGDQTPFTTVTNAGIYEVTTTAQNGCQASDEINVTSDPCASLAEQLNGIIIYPNPTQAFVTISNQTEKHLLFELRSIEGKLLSSGELISNSIDTTIDMRNMSNGTYLLNILNEEVRMINRIVKQ